MKLLIDIGNTRSKLISVHDADSLIGTNNVSFIKNALLNQDYLNKHWANISTVVIASVSLHSHTEEVATWAKTQGIKVIIVNTEKERFGVICAYQEYKDLGVDRWLALIGAHHKYPKLNVLVIDSGTATTLDMLSSDGKHVGGWIVPGINLLYSSLMNNTESINAHELPSQKTMFGESTSDCVNNGIWAMTVGAINQAIFEAEKYGEIDKIILCGGNGKKLHALLSNDKALLIEELVAYGLQQYLKG